MKSTIIYLVDTREQPPIVFGQPDSHRVFQLRHDTCHDPAGSDYSVAVADLAGFSIRLERKALSDLYSCVGSQRERFEAELRRLGA